MIIFVHMPKCGGSSIRTALKEIYGSRLKLYYSNPSKKHSKRALPFILRPKWLNSIKTDIVYGHFCFDQFVLYGHFNSIQKAMFFRNPIDIFCSSYFYNKAKHGKNESIQEYAERDEIKVLFDLYLGKTKIKDLNFIGLQEQFETSTILFRKVFNVELPMHHVNITKNRPIDYKKYLEDQNMLDFMVRKLDRNLRLYSEAKDRFIELAIKHNVDMSGSID